MLKKHTMNVHEEKRQIRKQNKCDKCDFTSMSQDNLRNHVETVHKQKCDKCDFESSTKEHLKNHMQTTHKQKRIKCDYCDKKFNKEETLNSHM